MVAERLFDVRGTRVVVTGAASGLGFAMAEVLAQAGARVTLADVDAAALERLELEGDVRTQVADVADAGQVDALIDGAVAAYGGAGRGVADARIPPQPGLQGPRGRPAGGGPRP